jgi:predicted ArsR family transcriptional regulator
MADETTQAVRSAIEDRAAYLYFLFKEMEAAYGRQAAVELAGRAIFRYGQAKASAMPPMGAPVDFVRHQMRPGRREIFDKEVAEEAPSRSEVRFHHCPLVQAWKRLGATREELGLLCDIAMQGDFGMVSGCPFTLRIAGSIAKGDACCRLVVEAKE